MRSWKTEFISTAEQGEREVEKLTYKCLKRDSSDILAEGTFHLETNN